MICRSEPPRDDGRRPVKPVLTPKEFAAFAHLPGWCGKDDVAGARGRYPHERFAVFVRAAPWPHEGDYLPYQRFVNGRAVKEPEDGWAGCPYGLGKHLYVRVSVWHDWDGRPFVVRVWDADDAYYLGPSLPTAYAANELVNQLVQAAPLNQAKLWARGFTDW